MRINSKTNLLLLCVFSIQLFSQHTVPQKDLSSYVNPFVGTKGEGNTFPGAVAPFGMIQLSPDTDIENWGAASGYEYTDSLLYGFSLTHFSGTGIPDLGDFLIVPSVGKIKTFGGKKSEYSQQSYRTPFTHNKEKASPAYYQVELPQHKINCELTASERAGVLKFTFPAGDSSNILIDLKHVLQSHVTWASVRIENDSTITGYHQVKGWARDRKVYFAARFSKKFNTSAIYKNGKQVMYSPFKTYRFVSDREMADTNIQVVVSYKTKAQEVILMKVAISGVSAVNALLNLDTEIPHWNFEQVRNTTREQWNKELGKVEINSKDQNKETFYSSLYHLFLTPFTYQDADSSYFGMNKSANKAVGFKNYTVFSLWDTYRAVHPYFMLVQQERNKDMISSMLAHYDQSPNHLLPVWSFYGNETWCMVGYHAVPVIADAVLKELKGLDVNKCYNAVRNTAMNPDYDNVKLYAELGYLPFDIENESVSKTLEYAYNDYCIALMAKKLGKTSDYDLFMKRAMSYKNLFDKSKGYMNGKDSKGRWRKNFGIDLYSETLEERDFTEGTSRQYSWYVPQDVNGLKMLMGEKAFEQKLDSLFVETRTDKAPDEEIGSIGNYWHGNEPSHHIVYLYNYVNKPWKTQKMIHQIVDSQYGNQPHSLCGNDDCGQMSAWYLFACMGFYPVCPSSENYIIGSPCIEEITLHLSNKKDLEIKAIGLSKGNIYIQGMSLNGKDWDKTYLPYNEIKNGGKIIYRMGAQPSKWGTSVKSIPPTQD